MPEIPYSWLEGRPGCYTVADLQAMTNDDLNALAAELRGVKRIGGDNKGGDWVDEFDEFYDEFFAPATDRNESGKLLQWAMERGAEFEISIAAESCIEFCDACKCWNSFDIDSGLARAETIAFCAAMLAMEGRLASDISTTTRTP